MRALSRFRAWPALALFFLLACGREPNEAEFAPRRGLGLVASLRAGLGLPETRGRVHAVLVTSGQFCEGCFYGLRDGLLDALEAPEEKAAISIVQVGPGRHARLFQVSPEVKLVERPSNVTRDPFDRLPIVLIFDRSGRLALWKRPGPVYADQRRIAKDITEARSFP